MAVSSPLLEDVNLAGARGILVNVTAGLDLSIGEFEEVGNIVREFASEDATVVVGTVIDPELSNELRVTVVATGLGRLQPAVLQAPVAQPRAAAAVGVAAAPGTFTRSELVVAAGVIAINGTLAAVRDNRTAFFVALMVCGAGIAVAVSALVSQAVGVLAPLPFMILIGLGLYMPYVAVHTTVFERLLAMTRDRGTVAFLMYVADAFGYLGYVGVMLGRNLRGGQPATGSDFLAFFGVVAWSTMLVSAVMLVIAVRAFVRMERESTTTP